MSLPVPAVSIENTLENTVWETAKEAGKMLNQSLRYPFNMTVLDFLLSSRLMKLWVQWPTR